MKAFYFVLPLLIASCWNRSGNSGQRLDRIDTREVVVGEIKKGLYDTISVQLSSGQIARLAELVNNKGGSLYKTVPEYCIFIQLKNGTLKYKVRDHLIGQRDLYIELDDTGYFSNIYEHGKKQPALISVPH